MNNFETDRLNLSELTQEDAAFMLELLNSPGWLKYIGDRGVRSLEDAANYILGRIVPSYRKNNFGFYLVKLKDGNVPIGICGLVKREGLEHIDIGFAFLPGYEGMGYGY
jgi:RimJ/RimL family protein N-acetyltransferase